MFFRASTVFTSLLLVAPALAEAPSPDKRGFKVELHSRASHNPQHAGKAPKSGHAHPYAKRLKHGPAHPRRGGAKAHQGHPPFLAATKAGSGQSFANLTNVENIDWSVEVTFGSPPQRVPLFLSMGSSLSSVADQNIKSDAKTRYNPSKSLTARNMTKAQVDPNTGVTFITYKDKISIGGFEVSDQTFAVMTSTPNGDPLEGVYDSPVPWAGALALGRASKGTPSLSFLENLIRSKVIDNAVCGISLTVEGGALFFGGLDSHSFKGNIVWSPVETHYMEGFWTIKTGGWGWKGKVANGTAGLLQFAPENTYTYIPAILGNKLFAGIKNHVDSKTQRYLLPCNSNASDTIGFFIHNRMFPVPIPDLILFPSDSDPTMCHTALLQVTNNHILDDYTVVMGALHMRSFYTILSYEKEHGGPAIGLAESSIKVMGGDPGPGHSEK
ncbi:BQ5605_C018g08639 [Microbotryum silenes-dioicae]|uniref:BQ5605_C018g08639 protein n=1 Tax=Microbotryum silenes-dioicae TaxID=796604 RepID=A0A2X0M0K4_9BASI|nr:BQ5605_C018g08639 [Microbotryum silenes-dioicae]